MDVDNFGTVEDAIRPAAEQKQDVVDEGANPVSDASMPEGTPIPDHAQRDGNIPGHEPVCPYSGACQRFSPYYYVAPRAIREAEAIELSGKPDFTAAVIHMLFPWWPGQEGAVRTAADTGADEDMSDDPSR
jgi:hypothetical protein